MSGKSKLNFVQIDQIRAEFPTLAEKHGKTEAYRKLAFMVGVSISAIYNQVKDLAVSVPDIPRTERGRRGGKAKKGKTKVATVASAPPEPSGGNCEDVVIMAAGMLIKNYERMTLELAEKSQKMADLERLYEELKRQSVDQHTTISEYRLTIETLNKRIIELQDAPKRPGSFKVSDSLGEESRRNIEKLMTEAKSIVGV